MPPAKPAAKPAAKSPVRAKRAATSAAKTDVSAKKATVPAPKPAAPARLQFVFTKTSFRIDHPEWVLDDAEETLKKQFQENRARALFSLGFSDPAKAESTSLAFLRQVSTEFMKALTDMPELELARENTEVSLSYETSGRLLNSVPFGLGTEYITDAYLRRLFSLLNEEFSEEISAYQGTVQMFLAEKSQKLRVPERVFFHLVESDKDEPVPFAFLATYATKTEDGVIRHMPLSYALEEFRHDRGRLLTLLSCLNQASEVSELVGQIVASGEMFHPLRFTAEEAFEFLKDVPQIEGCGIICRVPNWWKRRYAGLSVNVKLGEERPSMLDGDSLIRMKPELSVDGIPLTKEEIDNLLKQTDGLAYLKGRWVEVNHARLEVLLEEVEKNKGDLSILQALRMETGIAEDVDIDGDIRITNGKWLGDLLARLRQPASLKQKTVPSTIRAELRPYQKTGYNWLMYMQSLGFGACLADDMGLGKTLQVLTWLDKMRKQNKDARVLLIVPASLLGNWQREAERFAPKISVSILHGQPSDVLRAMIVDAAAFLTITTYGMVNRLDALREIQWDALILDEAQAIKNPGTKQTRAIKKLTARQKVALTGTPIENDLTNLWSLFDFLNKGLLGTSDEFNVFAKQLESHPEGYQRLKNMVSPFILRRLKTDKMVISDLPDKMEQVDYVGLTKKQIVLYRKQVDALEMILSDDNISGIQRRGIVLATITKLKQICNHPDQFLGLDGFDPKESGKFGMLREICETISEKRERVLVFTQYKEITEFLSAYLEKIFGCKGFVLHGGTRIKRRTEMVEEFNSEEYIPYMILSVKAGGTGLNLTAANHVIHFDRWWNPAVENQATDRAFRIGQDKNVIVHKLVCEGTIEERIDAIINSKKELAENVIGAGGENWITEMGNKELMDLMRLSV